MFSGTRNYGSPGSSLALYIIPRAEPFIQISGPHLMSDLVSSLLGSRSLRFPRESLEALDESDQATMDSTQGVFRLLAFAV